MKHTRNDFSGKNKSSRRSFYVAVWTAAVCLLAVGGVYYSTMQQKGKEEKRTEARRDQSVETPGQNRADGQGWIADADGNSQESREASAVVKPKKKNAAKQSKPTGKDSEKKTSVAKKEANSQTKPPTQTTAQDGDELSFHEEKGLSWPVKGDVLMKFSEKNIVYFKTLAQYRSNPAIEISASEGTKVKAAAAGKVTGISQKEETGTTVTMDIGGNYTVVYGQLKDVSVKKGQSVAAGEAIGKVAAPTKYFTEEGGNLYFQVMQNGKAIDPLLLLQ